VSKTRVYDLAKQYDMSGQDLAAKLRDLGFSHVKSHMSALSDSEVMIIQGRLEGYGIVGVSDDKPEVENLGGLVIKRKKKKKAPEPEAEVEAPVPSAVQPLVRKVKKEEPAPIEAEVEEAPVVETPAAAKEVAQPSTPAPSVEDVATPVVEPSATLPDEPESATAEVEVAPEGVAQVETVKAEAEVTTPVAPVETAAEAAQVESSEAAAPETEAASITPKADEADQAATETGEKTDTPSEAKAATADDVVKPKKPTVKRRAGKVVGFIDLSKIQTRQPDRPQSRRLSSSDDVTPNVQPTMGRDRKDVLRRGDQGTRGALTAGQLREREASRFLRRRPTAGGRGGGRGGRGGPKRDLGSPFAGQAVRVEEPVTVKKLAEAMSVKGNDLLKVAWKELGFGTVNIISLLDQDTAMLLAGEFEVDLTITKEEAAEDRMLSELSNRRSLITGENLAVRPPAVCFLGHVDHGKTTLVDGIRRSRITNGEAGGITQHIGAYQVTTEQGHTLAIVDTPGHAAFTAMRARGAQAVDIAVLVVAADDGVMPQTEEAIQHAKAAGTPIVVALNKMDKPEANAERVKTQLTNLGLQPEEWGGETAIIEVSALKGDGVEELLERLFLESEVLELTCHLDGAARGVVLEAQTQKGKGKIAHLLIQDGTLSKGDVFLAGKGYGKVRSITNDLGKIIKTAGPGTPVEVTGLNTLPNVGDTFHVVDSLDKAKEVADERGTKIRMVALTERRQVTSINVLEAVAEQDIDSVTLVLRGDMQGSVEVLKQQLADLTHDEVKVNVILSGVGEIVESDIDLAATSGATVLAFHVGTNTKARKAAERQHVEVRNFNVIYELLDYVRKRMESSLSPEFSEEITGHAEIRRVFPSSRFGSIAGCAVLDGTISRDNKCRILRDGTVVHTGSLSGLRREKEDAKKVREGFECGILIKDYNDIKPEDVIETFKIVESRRELEI
jgi:translation initiation factor IF-2